MCFRVVFDKTIIGKLPGFSTLLNENFPQGDVSAFHFPVLPVLAADDKAAQLAQWGLIPYWAREADKAKKIRSGTVNARSETIHEKPSFRSSWPGKRCLLPVTGFFEPHLERGKKETWKVVRKDKEPFFLGGLYARTPGSLLGHEGLAGVHERTFTLLTREAEGLLAMVHNEKLRMPFLFTLERGLDWLKADGEGPLLLDGGWLMDQDELEAGEII